MTYARLISYLFSLCVAALFIGCESEPQPLNVAGGDREGDVTLSLRVSIGNAPGGSGTRALFEEAADAFEKINTLRVIIVREDDNIEYNRIIKLGNTAVEMLSDLEFKVSTSLGAPVYDEDKGAYTRTEKKRIYLIANEASIQPEELRKLLDELRPGYYMPNTGDDESNSDVRDEFVRGDKLTPAQAAGWIMYNSWRGPSETLRDITAVPMIDNSGVERRYVPMTEFFDIAVTSDLTNVNDQKTQHENLFITRNLVKFQFTVDATRETLPFRVTKLTFNKLMQKEYLFPHDTDYLPAKYRPDGKVTILSKEEREIVKYKTPPFTDDNLVAPYVFTPTDFGYNGRKIDMVLTNYKSSYSPYVYFCETRTLEGNENNESLFDISLDVEFQYKGKDANGNTIVIPETVSFNPYTLSLPYSLPRNTIVKVNIRLGEGNIIKFDVELVPYIGCILDPWFGLPEENE